MTLGKSFALLDPSILGLKVREVGWNLATRFFLLGKCMGGAWLNGHVLDGQGLNEFINEKTLCQLENTI